jgi:nucleoside-diphosphate-sugar epimerase
MADSLRVVVTGGSGHVGRWMVPMLLHRGHQVVNVDRRPGNTDARFIEGDVHDRDFIKPILAESDAVCHCAEIAAPRGPSDELFSTNTRACAVVLQAAADLGLRHSVYCSTCQVYGTWGPGWVAPARLPIDENDPPNPMNAYAVSKAANELFARYVSRERGHGISIFRFPWVVYDAKQEQWLRQLTQSDGKLVEGMNTFIHGEDLALAFALAIEKALPGCEIYNLAAAEVLSRVPLRERIVRHHPDFPPLPANWPDRKSPLLIEKAEKMLGWRPKWSAEAITSRHTSQLPEFQVESDAGGH